MTWENLHSLTCPHCGEPLKPRLAEQDEITCTNCTFHISARRFRSITEKRGLGADGTIIRMKWQMLNDGRCPICQNLLKPEERNPLIQRCITSTCTFRIHDTRLAEILADPEHPANRFKNR